MEQASALWTYIIGVAWNSHRSGVPYATSILVEKFVEDHYDEVFRYYARRLPSKEDAQDAT